MSNFISPASHPAQRSRDAANGSSDHAAKSLPVMSVKASLKATKVALDAEDFDSVVAEAQNVLRIDPKNYFAQVFLGRAFEKQAKLEDAAKSYKLAAELKPDDATAWLGLCSVYEVQGSKRIDEYRTAAVKAAEALVQLEDKHRCQTLINKLVDTTREHGTAAQYRRALEVMLPGSSVYDYLEGRIPHPSHTYLRIAEITEQEEYRIVTAKIKERRTRIGATLGQVTNDVKLEVLVGSDLEQLYRDVIDWSTDDEVRRRYEEKLLERAYDVLTILPVDRKAAKLDQVLTLAEGMVIIKHAFHLAWDLVLDSRDLSDLRELDVGILREYVTLFPEAGMSMILHAWLSSELSPFPVPVPPPDEESDNVLDKKAKDLSPEDRLLSMVNGLTDTEQSPFAHRLVSDYYLHLEEFESAIDTARTGLRALAAESTKLGMALQNTKDALNSVLGTALVHHESPRNHLEARRIFEDILSREVRATPALIGLGLILEETEDYRDAIDFFTKALEEDEGNVHVAAELAWCRALSGDYTKAHQELEACLALLKADNARARDLRAQLLYRIGVCVWELDTTKVARRDRNGAYARFISAIKTNVNFAPAYTSLGRYYADYSKDKKRARQCFQKAFELSSAETDAAERLAKSFADQGDWDIVEVVAQRVVDSGKARPPPGSKRKGISWPYSALGVVQMNKQDYQQAIVSFLAALRISPDDYQSYVGLGESYHNSGRYNSALRTFQHALQPPEGTPMTVSGETWFAKYMLANVHRELGDYEKAIVGLEDVLEERPREFGVLMSLLQTFVEQAESCLESGLFGQAIESAKKAIATAGNIAKDRPDTFNLWKALGDACLVFALLQSSLDDFPAATVQQLLTIAADEEAFALLTDLDNVHLSNSGINVVNGTANASPPPALSSGILVYKRAISACSNDIHAQAVAWYNLGWAENQAYVCSEIKSGRKYIKAAVRCFKRAIELEAGNAEFWNALGVVTTTLNVQVAQHAFVRSLHLNELNAKVWANLGVLYLLQNDHELAHQAFSRSQSTDPTYSHAWVGEGLIALLHGDAKEALNHFTHAFEISNSSSIISRRQYALSSFDHLLAAPAASNDLTKLIQPLFALDQLRAQRPHDLPYRHLAALLLERVRNNTAAISTRTDLCTAAEAEYEAVETLSALARFAHAKSDLARNLLSSHTFAAAAENAETALDLSADAPTSGLDVDSRRRLRLSSHLTAGLAYANLSRSSEAISMFRAALQESGNNPDVVCLLVQFLWSHGGSDEAAVAHEQLLECVATHPEHIGCVTLLGAIAALEEDDETSNAVHDDLLTLRMKEGLSNTEAKEIEMMLATFAIIGPRSGLDLAMTEAQTAIMLHPDDMQAWALLAEQGGNTYASAMALTAAQKALPPLADLPATELAVAFAGVGTLGDAQRAIATAPWEACGWEAMERVSSGDRQSLLI